MAVSDEPGRMTSINRFGDVANRRTLTPEQAGQLQHFTRIPAPHPAQRAETLARLIESNNRLRDECLRLGELTQAQAMLTSVVKVWASNIWPGHDMDAMIARMADYAPEAQVRVPLTWGILRAILVNAK